MKKLIMFSFMLSSFVIQAQMFDESFLDSLPAEVRADVLARSENQNEEETFRASDVSSAVPSAEELIDLKARLEADLYELEQRLQSGEKLELEEELKLLVQISFQHFKLHLCQLMNLIQILHTP